MLMQTIAFLGLGAMGARMAAHLLRADFPVVVYNRTPEHAAPLEALGAERADTPHAAAAHADLVISMVTDDDASRSLWLDEETGALHGLRAGSIAIESSTLTPAWVRELAQHIDQRGAAFLDAPVVGSRPQAEAGSLVYLVGGSHDVFERVQPVLAAMGGAFHHLGPIGAGTTMKLAVNAYLGIQVAALGEVLDFARKGGLAYERAAEVLTGLAVMSPALKGVAGQMVTHNFAPLFPVDLIEKDLRYAAAAAEENNALAPTIRAVQAVFAQAVEAGYGADNMSGVARLFD